MVENDHSSLDKMNLKLLRDWKPMIVLYKTIHSFVAMIMID